MSEKHPPVSLHKRAGQDNSAGGARNILQWELEVIRHALKVIVIGLYPVSHPCLSANQCLHVYVQGDKSPNHCVMSRQMFPVPHACRAESTVHMSTFGSTVSAKNSHLPSDSRQQFNSHLFMEPCYKLN